MKKERLMELAGVQLNEEVNQNDFEKLVELIIDVNLNVPVNLDNKINRKLNAVEAQLKKMGIDPRSKKFKQNQ